MSALLLTAARDFLRVAPTDLRCTHFHHNKKDQHGMSHRCPCEMRYGNAMRALKEAIKIEMKNK